MRLISLNEDRLNPEMIDNKSPTALGVEYEPTEGDADEFAYWELGLAGTFWSLLFGELGLIVLYIIQEFFDFEIMRTIDVSPKELILGAIGVLTLGCFILYKKGKIIGISSVVAISGNPGQSNYVSSKSGMVGFYKSVAHEVASRNINVNIVSPGFIISPMTDKLTDVQKNKMLENIPMKKFGEPNDVANLVYFLSSDKASYITGQNFHVNGGMLMV